MQINLQSIAEEQWPSYLKLEMYTPNRTFRFSSEHKLRVPLEDDTLQACCAKVYNDSPEEIQLCDNINIFKCLTKTFLGTDSLPKLFFNIVFALI